MHHASYCLLFVAASCVKESELLGLTTLVCGCNEHERDTPYFIFRALVEDLHVYIGHYLHEREAEEAEEGKEWRRKNMREEEKEKEKENGKATRENHGSDDDRGGREGGDGEGGDVDDREADRDTGVGEEGGGKEDTDDANVSHDGDSDGESSDHGDGDGDDEGMVAGEEKGAAVSRADAILRAQTFLIQVSTHTACFSAIVYSLIYPQTHIGRVAV